MLHEFEQIQKKSCTIPTVCKAMELLCVLAERKEEETSTKALAISLGLPYATCYRILRSFVLKNWVIPVKGGFHEMSMGLYPLLQPLWREALLSKTISPIIEKLAQRLSLKAIVAIRQGDYAVTVACSVSPEPSNVKVWVGEAFQLALGSTGAVLLSEFAHDEIQRILCHAPQKYMTKQKTDDVIQRIKVFRTHGWCATIGSARPRLNTLSAPLYDKHGAILAVMTLMGFPGELPFEKLAVPVKMLIKATRQAEEKLYRKERKMIFQGGKSNALSLGCEDVEYK